MPRRAPPRPLPGAARPRLRPPRRLRVLRPGALLLTGTVALGFATLNTGNNLLFLLLGTLLGMILLSGALSERTLAAVTVVRVPPGPLTAGRPGRLTYEIAHRGRRLPACAVEVLEPGLEGSVFVALLERGEAIRAAATVTPPLRGIYSLERVTLATAFPFGFFRKERDVEAAGVLVVRPPTDRAVRTPTLHAPRGVQHAPERAGAGADRRGAFRGLRPWRTGDDPRDVHWRSTARMGAPVVREFDRESGDATWLVLDVRAPLETAEQAVEVTAALAARLTAAGVPWGFAAGQERVRPGTGLGRLDLVLDLLAGLEVGPSVPRTRPPAPPAESILVTAAQVADEGWLDLYRVERP